MLVTEQLLNLVGDYTHGFLTDHQSIHRACSLSLATHCVLGWPARLALYRAGLESAFESSRSPAAHRNDIRSGYL